MQTDSTKMIANELMAVDFRQEIDHQEKLSQETKAYLVGPHNDLHSNDILSLDKLEKIVICLIVVCLSILSLEIMTIDHSI